jgi:hypothetical protein
MAKVEKLTRSVFAKSVGVSSSMVTKWIAAGMPKRADGLLDAAVCHSWLTANIQQRTGEVAGERFSDAKARKESALASLRELELSVRQGKLLDVAEVRETWSRHIAAAKNRLLMLESKVPAECMAAVKKEVRAALVELSEYNPAAVAAQEQI